MNNKKKIIAAILILLLIFIIIYITINMNKKETYYENNITREEYNDKIIEDVINKLSNSGIQLMKNKNVIIEGIKGFGYSVIENENESEKTLEIYAIEIKDKIRILGKNAKDGEVNIDKTSNTLLFGNILIANISDRTLMNEILNILK